MFFRKKVVLYTDGACQGNPGPGGWGVVMRCDGKEKEMSGGERDTTNNRMELMAVICGLEALKKPCDVAVYSDSKYVIRGMTEWLENWQKNQWKSASKKPVKNVDLWKKLAALAMHHRVTWHWVKGHAGCAENERADALARMGVPTPESTT